MELTPVRLPAPRHSQRGAAILIAMIIVTLISTMAATMVWQQWRSVQVEASERVRAQATWILAGALDYARLILREDSNSPTQVDHLGEPWAVPLAESRISTFLAGDNAGDGNDGPEAFLSGTIVDASAKYNLRNLPGVDGKLDQANLETFLRLADSAGVSEAIARQIAQSLLEATRATGVLTAASAPANPAAPLMPQSVDQLRWFGIDAQTIKLLEPLVVILPEPTLVNVNTASKEVIAAVVKGMDLGTAQRIVTQRQSKPFQTVAELNLGPQLQPLATGLDVKTNYFEVTGRLRLGDKVLEERSLVARVKPNTIKPIQRHRVSSIDYAG